MDLQLRELLHIAGEKTTTIHENKEQEFEGALVGHQLPLQPALVGQKRRFHAQQRQGLPKWLPNASRYALFRSAVVASSGNNPVLRWQPPIASAQSLKLTLLNRQHLQGAPNRLVKVTLRAKKTHCGRPALHDVRVAVNEDTGPKVHFARCISFMRDAEARHYVALRWYLQTTEGSVADRNTGLVRLKLAPEHLTRSYSVMPIECILNGACILPCGSFLYVVQSPREEAAYRNANTD